MGAVKTGFKLVNSKTAKGLSQKNIIAWVFDGAEDGVRRSLAHAFSKKAIMEMATDDGRPFTPAFKQYVWENHDFAVWGFLDGDQFNEEIKIENPIRTRAEMEAL